jgi:tRNA threonylcarbamoyladenosine biosynthesis protein TsaB
MLILATDTSGKNGSIALARVQDTGAISSAVDVLEVVPLEGGSFSAQLVPQIATLLSRHGSKKENIGAFVVASGPGSFTGLRVGLAAIKALAEVTGKPIAAVSLLEVVARSGKARGKVMAALDAGRGEIYAGVYDIAVDQTVALSEQLLSKEEFVQAATGLLVVTPSVLIAALAGEAGWEVEEIDSPRSDMIARLGWEKIQQGKTVSPEELEANYIRRSDAEIFSKTL